MYQNPILDGDFCDPDVVRVGDDYWMITSSMHLSPGMTVLHSSNLLDWTFVTHCVPDLTVLGADYCVPDSSRFGRGIYAGSIRFHAGRFWVYFMTLDEGLFMTAADHPAGPWDPVVHVWAEQGWDDPCPIWTGEQAWLVASHPGPSEWFSYLFPMSTDGRSLDVSARTVLDDTHTSEANKVYEIGGMFFVLHNEVQTPGSRTAVVMRSRSMTGPWEKRNLLEPVGPDLEREPCQGALVDHHDGSWSFVTHHGRMGYPEGRPVSVVPVEWIDGWPVASPDPLGVGRMAWTPTIAREMPARSVLQRSDDLQGSEIGPQWQWNCAVDAARYTCSSRGLEIRAGAAARGLQTPPVSLGQRSSAREGEARVRVDVSRLQEGGYAGLGHISDAPSAVLVHRHNGRLRLEVHLDGITVGPDVGEELWLSTSLDSRGFASFAWSDDGAKFDPIGASAATKFSGYRGSRVSLITFGFEHDAGYATFSGFEYSLRGTQERQRQ